MNISSQPILQGEPDSMLAYTPRPPTDARTLLRTPPAPYLIYPYSYPWPTQGPVEMPLSYGPGFDAGAQGPSPICMPGSNVQRIVVQSDFPDVWDQTTVSIPPGPPVSAFRAKRRVSCVPPSVGIGGQSKGRKIRNPQLRTSRNIQGIRQTQNKKRGNEFMGRACFCCVFNRKKCEYTKGEDACKSCIERWTSGRYTIVRNPDEKHLPIKRIFWFEMRETYGTMIELWNEMAKNLGPQARRIFYKVSRKQIVCSMSCDVTSTPFSNRLQPVVVTPPSTNLEATKGGSLPDPPFDVNQSTRFIDRQIMDQLGHELYALKTDIITAALRCGMWLRTLFNFDENAVYRSYDIDDLTGKNLIIWAVYSIVHQINQNHAYLYREIERSFNSASDPEVVACAVATLYKAVHTHYVPSGSKTLKSLDKFLKDFHRRSKDALGNLKYHRKLNEYHTCQAGGKDVRLRKRLISIQSALDPVMHLKFESSEALGIPGLERTAYLGRHSQMQILLAAASSLEKLDFEPQTFQNQDLSESSTSERVDLTAELLRRHNNEVPMESGVDDCSSQYATTEENSTIAAGDAVPDNSDEAWCSSQLGATDLEEMGIQKISLKLGPTEFHFDNVMGNGDYLGEFSEEIFNMDIDSEVANFERLADIENSSLFRG